MTMRAIMSTATRGLIGASMRIYRASPLYPRLGYLLAKLLAIVTGNKPRIVTREIDGVKFELDLREIIGASLYYSGSFEPEAEATIAAVLKPGMTAVDIGANF